MEASINFGPWGSWQYEYSVVIKLGGTQLLQQSGIVDSNIVRTYPWVPDPLMSGFYNQFVVNNTVDVSSLTSSGSQTLTVEAYLRAIGGGRTWSHISAWGSFQVPVLLRAYDIGATGGERTALSYYRQNSEWYEDALTDEGVELVNSSGYRDEDTDGSPERGDPIAYMTGATPALTNVVLKAALPGITAAKIRITTPDSSLQFDDVDVTFTDGQATYPYGIPSLTGVGDKVANKTLELDWSVSVDNGASFTRFQTTFHTLWVVLGQPYRMPDLPCCEHWTAARIDWATQDAYDAASPEDAVGKVRARVLEQVQFGENNITDDDDPDYESNPWKVLELGATNFDCISLSIITATELNTIGAQAGAGYAYATGGNPAGDGDPSEPEQSIVDGQGVVLNFFWSNGETINNGEGFFFLGPKSSPSQGYTVAPTLGPFQAFQGSVLNLADDLWKRLAFSAIRSTFASVRSIATSPRGGQQWWVAPPQTKNAPAIPVGTDPVPFPVSIP